MFAGLYLTASADGATPTAAEQSVIVELDLPAAATGRAPQDGERVAAIRARQQQVLDSIAGHDVDIAYLYDAIPAMALTATGEVIDRLQANPLVRRISPNFAVHAALNESAPLINADEPRDVWGITGAGVTVAVLDTGIDTDHPDLADDIAYQRCYSENATCPGNTTSASGPGAAEDENGHGTNVSGVITGNGSIAPEGIASDAQIAAYRVLGPTAFGTYADIIAGLQDVLMNHPEVGIINMSITDSGNWGPGPCDGFLDPMGASIVNDLRAAGTLTFASSGNNGYTGGISWPSCLSGVVSTGAVWDATLPTVSFLGCTQTPAPVDAVTCFSNSSSELDLLAPGAFISATGMGGGTSTYGGTSQASPTAAAVAAMLLQANPALTPATIESTMESTGVPITDSRNSLVRPRVDATAALLAAADGDGDGLPTPFDNCGSVANPGQENADKDARPNGPLLSGDDATWPMSDKDGDACDLDDDNDGVSDNDEASGAACSGIVTNPLLVDHDGDHLTDGWECGAAPPSDPTNAASKNLGSGSTDADSDRIIDNWEMRGYNASGASSDSDGDGCHDLVETASVDGNKTVADPDRLAVARRALGIWAPEPEQDLVLDIDKNGIVGDPDRLFVARAALLADWLPKSCP